MFRRICLSALLVFMVVSTLLAQEALTLSLQTSTVELQTGQAYDVDIRIEGAANLWITEVEISFDPTLIYVMGTKAGSPVQPGDVFPADTSAVIRNFVQENQLVYTVSLVGAANPANGSGAIGHFRIYPLAPGTTQLMFRQAEVRALDADNALLPVSVLPVLLQLNLTGSPVELPVEATATPRPSDTPEATLSIQLATEAATLVNVTAAPQTPAAPDLSYESGTDVQTRQALLPVALGIVLVGGLGLVVMLLLWRRSSK